jgi:cystathionine beta-lyase
MRIKMKYNFDEIIDRKGFSAYKTDLCLARFGTDDLLPLWVADMDFRTPDFIMNAIKERANHEIMGYTIRRRDFFTPIIDWLNKRHNWAIKREWLGFFSGVVPAIALTVNRFTQEGDAIIVQTPIYPPFMDVVNKNKRKLVCNELVLKNGIYEIDFALFEKQIIENEVKLFIFCSPHNPGGRVWTKEELITLANICQKHNVLVVSDEIHADLALPHYKHIPFASVSDAARENSITLMAPSKTFNMPGLMSSSYIIPNKTIRNNFENMMEKLDNGGGNIFAYAATTAAYTKGEEWLEQLINYLQGNIDYVDNFLKTNIPQLKAMIPQASFLIWIDFRGLGLSDDEIKKLLIEKAKLGLNDGPSFGPGGEGFSRINIACSRKILEEAMNKLKKAIG